MLVSEGVDHPSLLFRVILLLVKGFLLISTGAEAREVSLKVY